MRSSSLGITRLALSNVREELNEEDKNMKRRIVNWVGIAIMAGAIAFSLVQLKIPVVKADGCPPAEAVGCACMFQDGVSVQFGSQIIWTCTYLCGSCGGDVNNFLIEQTITVVE